MRTSCTEPSYASNEGVCPFPKRFCIECEWGSDSPMYNKLPASTTFYMCYVEGKNAPAFKHPTCEEAEREAERLAKLPSNIGKEVFILKAIEKCHTDIMPIEWEILK